MLILGIDPGIAITGFGLVEECKNGACLLDYGCIVTDKSQKPEERLAALYQEMSLLVKKSEPDQIAIEKLFFSKNVRTAMAVSQARGVLLLASSEAAVPIVEYTPLEIKLALTGYGKADKKQIQQMVKILLNLKEVPKPDDAADALAIAICHLNSYKIKSMEKENDFSH